MDEIALAVAMIHIAAAVAMVCVAVPVACMWAAATAARLLAKHAPPAAVARLHKVMAAVSMLAAGDAASLFLAHQVLAGAGAVCYLRTC